MRLISAEQAAGLIEDGATVVPGGFGSCGHPDLFTMAIEEKYRRDGHPKGLKLVFASGAGDKKGAGLDRLAYPGLVTTAIGGFWGLCPKLCSLGESGQLEAHNWPQGIMSKLFGCIAEGSPGVISKVGVGTFVDPDIEGGVFKPGVYPSLVRTITLGLDRHLFYPAIRLDVALLRGTVADEEGNVSLQEESSHMDALSQAMAVRNSGGKVFVQVKHVQRTPIAPSKVNIPGHLIDYVIESHGNNHPFTYGLPCPESFSASALKKKDLARSIIIKRALEEIDGQQARAVNFGIGIPAEVGMHMSDDQRSRLSCSVESGVIGGSQLHGDSFGAAINPEAIIDQSSLFQFYDGGGLDLSFLGFAQIDSLGNVNVSKFGKKRPGAGGFINITRAAKRVVFCGTLTAGGLDVHFSEGKLCIRREGDERKLVRRVNQITFASRNERPREDLIITERAVFKLYDGALTLTEIAPGLEPDDIKAVTDISFSISNDLSVMTI